MIAASVTALCLIAVLGVRWWTHPTVFDQSGVGGSADPRPVARAALTTTVIYPRVSGEPETITIDRLRAVFAENTAEATATFMICRLQAGQGPIGTAHHPEDYCTDLEPVEPGDLFLHGVAPDSDYLIVTIAPTRPGVAHLTDVEIDYRRGARHRFQQGTQSLAPDLTVIAE